MKCPVCKKNISDNSLKCPYCKTRTGLLCTHCNTINPIGTLKCKNCHSDLVKICTKCNGVNFPTATKCRKCSSPFGEPVKKKKAGIQENKLVYVPESYSIKESVELLVTAVKSKDKKVISISGDKGVGKSTVLNSAIKMLEAENIQWCIGKCTPLTQLTPGGVVQDMLLNLFSLPIFNINNNELRKNAYDFFSKEFKFLDSNEINDFLNFIYSFKDGNYEDIIINKKKTFTLLSKIYDAFCSTGRFVFVLDNFDFIDGFSAEFFNNFISREHNWKNLKFIAIYNEAKPISGFFGSESKSLKAFADIHIKPLTEKEIEKDFKFAETTRNYLSDREKEVIAEKSKGNLAYLQQAYSYAFDCQISDKTFILPDNFSELIKTRLEVLKKSNVTANKVLSACAILGDKINTALVKEIFTCTNAELDDVLFYLEKSNFIRPLDENFYEFNNLLLWETVLKNITRDSEFDDINVKIGRAVSVFNLNTNATMAMIAHNLKENRMAFDIWTKTTRLAAYVGDINLYVIAQKQCLALINEFNENETLNIRYNISEKLGKLLSEYDPEEALEFLPDAISNAKTNNDDVKEIELLSYLANCCSKTGNYFGNVECVDNVLKKIEDTQELEKAMVLSTKLPALLDIGNCGEVINLCDNDILPILNNYLAKPKMNKTYPLGLLFDSWLKVHLALAHALSLQGNIRSLEVIKNLFNIIDKHKINDKFLIGRIKIVQAYANTMAGKFEESEKIIQEVEAQYLQFIDYNSISRKNLVSIVNSFMQKEYNGMREKLFDAVTFANNTGDSFTKNILKTLLGKLIKDENRASHAIEIYNEQVTYFANEKMALGALLSWFLIADATIVTENSKSAIDIATQALDISLNPKIANYFFAINLRMVIARAYMNIADFTTAKINIEEALKLAKNYKMDDMLSRAYLLYGRYYHEIGTVASQKRNEYLTGASIMYEKALETVISKTKNLYIKAEITENKEKLNDFCIKNGIKL